jgi:hypothetical protein
MAGEVLLTISPDKVERARLLSEYYILKQLDILL